MRRLLLGALVGLLLAVPGATAAPAGLRDDLSAAGIALAGPEVLVARERVDGRIQLDAVALATGAVRRVLSVASPEPGWRGAATVAASAERVGLIAELRGRRGRIVEWRLYSGPPGGPLDLVLRVPEGGRGTWIPILLDADGERLLVTEIRLRGSLIRARVLEPGGALVPLPWAGRTKAPVALAGPHAAVFASGPGDPSRVNRVALVDGLTGAEQAAVPVTADEGPEAGAVDVAADGRLVAAVGPGLALTQAGAAAPRTIPGRRPLSIPRFSGGTIAAVAHARWTARPVAVAPADGARQPLGRPTGFVEDLVADDRGVAWLANGCVRYAAVAGPPVATPAADPCPSTEIGLFESESRLRGRTVRVPVHCIDAPGAACHGTVVLRRGGVVAGRGGFAVPVGTRRRVDVRLTRRGLRRVRAPGSENLHVDARMSDGRVSSGRGSTDVVILG